MSPLPLRDLRIKVTLAKGWDFDMLYPLATPRPSQGDGNSSCVSWTVSTHPDGTITDESTKIACSYLFWEARVRVLPPVSRAPPPSFPLHGVDEEEVFDPSSPSFTPSTTVVLPFDDFVPYLDRTLGRLALTAAMRTDFIVFWLPNFRRIRDNGLHIAIRFVRQKAFEAAARLEVDGASPSTVARVFMLFGGVDTGTAGKENGWHGRTMTLVEAEEVDWARRAGIDVEGMRDETKFRILEWGGMEIPLDQRPEQ
jgi:hypothetical protein